MQDREYTHHPWTARSLSSSLKRTASITAFLELACLLTHNSKV